MHLDSGSRVARTEPISYDVSEPSGPQDSPWTLLGEKGKEALALPSLPAMVRRDLIGPMEILLALAGQIGRVSLARFIRL